MQFFHAVTDTLAYLTGAEVSTMATETESDAEEQGTGRPVGEPR